MMTCWMILTVSGLDMRGVLMSRLPPGFVLSWEVSLGSLWEGLRGCLGVGPQRNGGRGAGPKSELCGPLMKV